MRCTCVHSTVLKTLKQARVCVSNLLQPYCGSEAHIPFRGEQYGCIEHACRAADAEEGLARSLQADIERYKDIARQVLPFVGDTVELVNDAWEAGKRILVEGANATMLDLDFGTYPFVTSSNPSIGGVASGLGLAPTKFQAIIGVVRGSLHSPIPREGLD